MRPCSTGKAWRRACGAGQAAEFIRRPLHDRARPAQGFAQHRSLPPLWTRGSSSRRPSQSTGKVSSIRLVGERKVGGTKSAGARSAQGAQRFRPMRDFHRAGRRERIGADPLQSLPTGVDAITAREDQPVSREFAGIRQAEAPFVRGPIPPESSAWAPASLEPFCQASAS